MVERIHEFTISQDGASVVVRGEDAASLREKAYRIARASLLTGKGDVTIHKQHWPDKKRLVAKLGKEQRHD